MTRSTSSSELSGTGVALGRGALPSQRTFVQDVELRGVDGQTRPFAWTLCMQGDGCWLVQSIEAL